MPLCVADTVPSFPEDPAFINGNTPVAGDPRISFFLGVKGLSDAALGHEVLHAPDGPPRVIRFREGFHFATSTSKTFKASSTSTGLKRTIFRLYFRCGIFRSLIKSSKNRLPILRRPIISSLVSHSGVVAAGKREMGAG